MPRNNAASNRNMRVRAPEACRKFDLRTSLEADGMFARAVSAPRLILPLLAALVALSGCGAETQDANEPEGSYRLEVADASFPATQGIA